MNDLWMTFATLVMVQVFFQHYCQPRSWLENRKKTWPGVIKSDKTQRCSRRSRLWCIGMGDVRCLVFNVTIFSARIIPLVN